ncbi:MAG: tRNA uridine-5-carboxymethylaminomethyl(34) synthesis GTPase MnmE, partial [Clostridia bacterium]|nr:tRNA uridine-5-carboxymethylaminomethyl(34) synthesis GTPase MnmE [Clostridia bacterium]
IGIKRALAEIDSAELILAVFDSSKELTQDDEELLIKLKALPTPTVILENKSDISSASKNRFDGFERIISISAKTGEGFDALADTVESLFIDGEIDISSDAVVSDARQYSALLRGADALTRAIGAISAGVSLDLCCIDIEDAMQSLGELEGREVGEDIVSEIFSKFCVGK